MRVKMMKRSVKRARRLDTDGEGLESVGGSAEHAKLVYFGARCALLYVESVRVGI